MHRAVDAHHHLAALAGSSGDVEVDFAHMAERFLHAESVVLRKAEHLLQQKGDEHHKHQTDEHSQCRQPEFVVDDGIENHSRPAETQDEAGHRLDGDEIEPIGIKIGVAAAEIVVGVEADEERNGLHQEDGAGHDGRSPIDIVHGVLEKEVKKSRTLCLHK